MNIIDTPTYTPTTHAQYMTTTMAKLVIWFPTYMYIVCLTQLKLYEYTSSANLPGGEVGLHQTPYFDGGDSELSL